MKTIAKVTIGVFVGFSLLAYVLTYVRTRTSDTQVLGGPQDGYPNRSVVQEDGRPATKHVDLGDGLELTETSESRNGEVVWRYVRITRNGQTLLTSSWVTQLGKGIRTYFHDGKEVVSEVVDKNGEVEMVILVGTDGMPIEVFERNKQGTILPVGNTRLDEMRKGARLISETFGPIVEAARKGTDKSRMRRLVEDAVEKVEEAASESSGGKGDSRNRYP